MILIITHTSFIFILLWNNLSYVNIFYKFEINIYYKILFQNLKKKRYLLNLVSNTSVWKINLVIVLIQTKEYYLYLKKKSDIKSIILFSKSDLYMNFHVNNYLRCSHSHLRQCGSSYFIHDGSQSWGIGGQLAEKFIHNLFYCDF